MTPSAPMPSLAAISAAWSPLLTPRPTHTGRSVTAFVRAPFTRFQEATGHGEVSEEPRGDGFRYAIGELLICPYCMSQWIVGAFAVGMVAQPRFTRLIASAYTAQTIADFLQLAYLAAEERASTD